MTPGLVAALAIPCAELAPPTAPTVTEVEAAPRMELSLAEVVWLGHRSAYADQVRGCYLQAREDVEVVTVALEASEARAAVAEGRVVELERRPTWGVVAGVGAGGVVVGAALVVGGLVATR